jgi:hypothetical protein
MSAYRARSYGGHLGCLDIINENVEVQVTTEDG